MADSYSVQAILSAEDKNFTSTFRSAGSILGSMKQSIAGGLGFGVLAGVGQAAFNAISSGASGIVSDLSEASATWKTFTANMQMNGKSAKQIDRTRNSLQKFAQQTIYSSSDMASTYAQLDAVGTKHTTKLVKGFGGLAAAAENPAQAMKTLSQQATQMAAKPQVQWQDFKLMLEQTPAGISAVAKSMGKSTSQLIKDVQDGKVATEDFFQAIAKTGTNKAFTKLATQYKTCGQAMDGLKETMSNKLQPAFDVLSGVGIKAISAISDKIEEIDGSQLADKVTGWINAAQPYFDKFKTTVGEVGSAFGDAVSAIIAASGQVNGSAGAYESFCSVMDTFGGALKSVAGFMADHAEQIAVLVDHLPQLVAGYMAFKGVRAIAPGVMSFGSAISKLAAPTIGTIAGKLFGISTAQKAVGKSSSTSGKKMIASAKSFVMMAAGALLLAVAFALIAQSAVAVANAGPAAIAVFFGMVVAVAALGAGMAVLMKTMKATPKKMQAFSTAMLAIGAAVLLVSVGFAIMAQSAIALAGAGAPAVAVMFGLVAAMAALMVLASVIGTTMSAGAAGMVAFGAAVLLAGAGMYLLSTAAIQLASAGAPAIACMAGMAVAIAALAAVVAVLGPALLVGAAGLMVLGAALLVIGVAAVVAGAGLTLISSALPNVAAYGLQSAAALTAIGAAMVVFSVTGAAAAAVMIAFGAGVVVASAGALMLAAALVVVSASMSSIAANAASASGALTNMVNAVSVVESGLNALGDLASDAMDALTSAFQGAQGDAAQAGTGIGQNFARGLQTTLPLAVTVSKTAVLQINNIFRSGYSQAFSSGSFIGQGLANGMRSQLGAVQSAASQLAAAAQKAIEAKAKIGSPSKVTDKDGQWWGIGFGNGIGKSKSYVEKMSEGLLVPLRAMQEFDGVRAPSIAGFDGGLPETYSYGGGPITLVVPVDIDGREVARVTARYNRDEINKVNRRDNRARGFA